MIATDMTSSGSAEEKLRWAFKMFDEDGSGKVLLPSSAPAPAKAKLARLS